VVSGDAALTITYDSASQTYSVTTVAAGNPTRSQSWAPADRNAAASSTQLTVYSKPGTDANGAVTDTLTLSQPGTTGFLLYTYVGGGIWERSGNGATSAFHVKTTDGFVYGFPTGTTAVPRTGSGSYLIDIYGKVSEGSAGGANAAIAKGMGQLDANFATGALSLTGEGLLNGSLFFSVGGSGTIAAAGNSLSGNMSINVTGGFVGGRYRGFYSGPFDGSFFGPSAQELGAEFRLISGDTHMIGWFLGRALDTSSTRLQDLTSPRKLNGIAAFQNWDVITSGAPSLPTGSVQNGTGTAGTGSSPYAYPAGDAYVVNGVTFLPPDKLTAGTDSRYTTFQVTQGNVTYTLRAYRPGSANDQLVLSYMSFLDFLRTTPEPGGCTGCTAIDHLGYSIVYGLRTDPTAIPRTGTASYSGLIFGRGAADGIGRHYSMTGTASLTADFAGDQISGTLSPVLTNTTTGNQFAIGNLVLAPGGIRRTGPIDTGTNALITGALSGAGTGNYSAAFFGPGGEELGAAFTARGVTNPEAAGSPITVSGVALTKRN
jgi:hypothetical protein